MLNLVLKDFLIQKRTIPVIIIFSLVIFPLTQLSGSSYTVSVTMWGVLMSFMILFGAFGQDEYNQIDTVVNSLPVTRDQVVISRYLTGLISVIVSLSLILLGGNLWVWFGFLEDFSVTFMDVLLGGMSALAFLAVLIPVVYKYGVMNLRYISLVMIVLAIGVPLVLQHLAENSAETAGQAVGTASATTTTIDLMSQQQALLSGGGVLFVAVLVALSLLLSLRIYRKAEF